MFVGVFSSPQWMLKYTVCAVDILPCLADAIASREISSAYSHLIFDICIFSFMCAYKNILSIYIFVCAMLINFYNMNYRLVFIQSTPYVLIHYCCVFCFSSLARSILQLFYVLVRCNSKMHPFLLWNNGTHSAINHAYIKYFFYC